MNLIDGVWIKSFWSKTKRGSRLFRSYWAHVESEWKRLEIGSLRLDLPISEFIFFFMLTVRCDQTHRQCRKNIENNMKKRRKREKSSEKNFYDKHKRPPRKIIFICYVIIEFVYCLRDSSENHSLQKHIFTLAHLCDIFWKMKYYAKLAHVSKLLIFFIFLGIARLLNSSVFGGSYNEMYSYEREDEVILSPTTISIIFYFLFSIKWICIVSNVVCVSAVAVCTHTHVFTSTHTQPRWSFHKQTNKLCYSNASTNGVFCYSHSFVTSFAYTHLLHTDVNYGILIPHTRLGTVGKKK